MSDEACAGVHVRNLHIIEFTRTSLARIDSLIYKFGHIRYLEKCHLWAVKYGSDIFGQANMVGWIPTLRFIRQPSATAEVFRHLTAVFRQQRWQVCS